MCIGFVRDMIVRSHDFESFPLTSLEPFLFSISLFKLESETELLKIVKKPNFYIYKKLYGAIDFQFQIDTFN